jgi:excisionase family DNA binding protein
MKKDEKLVFNDDADRLLSIKEVAERMRTGQAFVGELINAGLLKVLKFKRERRIPKSVFNKFIADHVGEDLYEVLKAAKNAA